MPTSSLYSFSSSSNSQILTQHPAGLHSIIVFFFALNIMLGNGFLSIPYALYHTGLVAGCFLLLCITTVCCLTAVWILEVICRAQALEYWHQSLPRAVCYDASRDKISETSIQCSFSSYPTFEISTKRKFEISELCEIFLGKCGKMMYIITLGVYLFITCWAYATVAASSWASNLPWNITGSSQLCHPEDFSDVIFPNSTSCQNTYRFYLLVFSLIVIPLSCLEFVEQKYIQVFMTFFRMIAVLLMIVFSVVDVTEDNVSHASNNSNTTVINYWAKQAWTSDVEVIPHSTGSSNHTTFTLGIMGWSLSIPVFIYSLMIHQYVPVLAVSAVRKDNLRRLFIFVFGVVWFIYCLFGATISETFHSSQLLENAALNWAPITSCTNFGRQFLACIIVFFPSLDVMSLFPLVTITLSNNIYTVITGRDITSEDSSEHPRRWRVIILRILTAIVPLIAATFVTELMFIVKCAGVCGFVLAIIFPALLQINSRKQCRKIFANHFKPKDHRTEVADSIGYSWYGATQNPRVFRTYSKLDDIRKDTPYSSMMSFTTYAVAVAVFAALLLMFSVVGIAVCELASGVCYK